MLDWAFTQSGVQRVTAECLSENISSIRVLEKIGMQHMEIQDDLILCITHVKSGQHSTISRELHIKN